MATTITWKTSITIEGDDYPRRTYGGSTIERTQTNSGGGNPGIVSLTTSEEDIVWGEITSPREILIRNLSSTETIHLGPKSSGSMIPLIQIPPLGEHPLHLYQAVLPTLRWKATGVCRAEIAAMDS